MNSQFGKFQLLRKIATGGMAEIHIARQRGLEGFEKIVVIKKILPHLANNQEFVQMFLDEARIAARLTHPNVVQIYDLGRAGGTYFIAMEYVQGENLRTIAKHCRRDKTHIPLEHAVKIISQACEGLHYAHSKADTNGTPLNIVHRDISPQNIIVSFEGVTKLVDFGIAKAAVQAQETRAGILKGKYSYMSPEQCRGTAIDARSDIFSMGIVLWELTTGLRLYKLSSELLILKEITEGEVTPPRQLNAQIPAEIEAIILKALEKHPDNRFRDALEMHLALEDFLKNAGLTSSTVHLSAYMRDLFKEKLESIRKIEQAQAAGENLESMLFDDLHMQDDMYIPGTGEGVTPSSTSGASAAATTPSQPLYIKPSTGVSAVSRTGARPAKPPSGTGRNILLAVLLVALVGVLGVLGYLIYMQLNEREGTGTPVETTLDGGPTVTARTGIITVTSTPPGALVRLDGTKQGTTPLDIKDLELGSSYTLKVTKPNFRSWSTKFKLEDQSRSFNARLERVASLSVGQVEVTTDPAGARITLDRKPIEGVSPLSIPNVTAGQEHTLRASLKGHKDWVKAFRLEPNERLKLVGALTRETSQPISRRRAVYTLRSRPPGARFFLNGKPHTSKTVTLKAGERASLSAKLPGHKDWSEELTAKSGERRTIVARLPRIATPRGKARLSINSTPWAIVYVDGQHVGTTPVVGHALAAGSHKVRLVNNQIHSSRTITLEAKPGEDIKKTVKFRKGTLSVRAKPWAHVHIHGKKIGTTPFEPKELYEGSYMVVLENPTLGRTVDRKVTIKPGEQTVLKVNFLE